ncbi:MAG: hypothetical protein IJW36_02050 [Clostridia bacterium]|nr:hypothetical protein [Clostridia bacterium]
MGKHRKQQEATADEVLKEIYQQIKFNKYLPLTSHWFIDELNKLLNEFNAGNCNLTIEEFNNVKFMVGKMMNSKQFDEQYKEQLKSIQQSLEEIDFFEITK